MATSDPSWVLPPTTGTQKSTEQVREGPQKRAHEGLRKVPNICRRFASHKADEAGCSGSLSVKGDGQLLVHSRDAYTSGSRPPRRCVDSARYP